MKMKEELFENVVPFSGDMPVPVQEPPVLAEAAIQREIAEVQAMMTIAKRFPRNQKQSMDRIEVACQRPSLAESALYSYSRGGSEITGPSIRLAEAIAQNWGNLQFGIREIDQRIGESTVEAYAWDLETNTRKAITFQVRHVRKARGNLNKLDDPRDIYEMVANQGARRLRACILAIIPSDIVEAAKEQCEATLRARADISPEAIKKMLEKFGEYGVNKTMIEKRIQRNIESITAAQVIGLRKIYNSLKDGMSKPADWFDLEAQEEPKKERKPRSDKGQPSKETPQEPSGETQTQDSGENPAPAQNNPVDEDTETQRIAPEHLEKIKAMCKTKKIPPVLICQEFEVNSLEDMDYNQGVSAMEWVARM